MGFLQNLDWYQCYRTIIYLGCAIAAVIQLASVLEGYVSPTLTNTRRETMKLRDMDFPVVFKICSKPGYNTTALKEAGYDDASDYFFGRSIHDRSILGWAGHTNTSGVFGSVEEIMAKIGIKSKLVGVSINDELLVINMTDVLTIEKPNYPDNCQILDLTNIISDREENLENIYLGFGDLKNSSVEVHMEGSNLACHRNIKANAFYSGEAMKLDGEDGKGFKVYVAKIKKDVFTEEDPSSNCRIYPNLEFSSYR